MSPGPYLLPPLNVLSACFSTCPIRVPPSYKWSPPPVGTRPWPTAHFYCVFFIFSVLPFFNFQEAFPQTMAPCVNHPPPRNPPFILSPPILLFFERIGNDGFVWLFEVVSAPEVTRSCFFQRSYTGSPLSYPQQTIAFSFSGRGTWILFWAPCGCCDFVCVQLIFPRAYWQHGWFMVFSNWFIPPCIILGISCGWGLSLFVIEILKGTFPPIEFFPKVIPLSPPSSPVLFKSFGGFFSIFFYRSLYAVHP